MRTNEERLELIRRRTEELKTENQKKKDRKNLAFIGTAGFAACFAVLIYAASAMPGIIAGFDSSSGSHNSGVASLLAESDALGYVIMAILSFLLGVFLTLLLHVVHRRQQRKSQKDDPNGPDNSKNV